MSDPKLTAQMLDLSRNIEKLTGAVKTNTESSDKLEKSNSESEKGLKDTISKLGGDLKNLDFKGLSKELGGLKDLTKGFEGVTKSIKDLDFKKLGDDFKGVTKSFGDVGKNLGDIKSLKDLPKSFGDISKSFGGIKDLTKNFEGATKGLEGAGKIKDIVSGGFGKKILGAFAQGGPVPETGSYLVGEKGPEVVKLEGGSTVIPNNKLVSADQQLSEKRGPTEKQIEKYRNHLLSDDPAYYAEFPEELESEVKYWINQNRYQKEAAIESLMEGKWSETFSKEDIAKLSSPVSPTAPPVTMEEELSKSEKRKKEREEKKASKQKSKAEKKEEGLETKKESKMNLGSLGETSKSALSALKKNSGSLIGKATDIGSGILSKNIENPLLKKAGEIGLKSSAETLKKTIEKPKAVSNITPLKSPAAKPSESAEKKSEQISAENKKTESAKSASSAPSAESSPASKVESKTGAAGEKVSSKGETNMTKADIDDMKSALFRIASLLEGTLMVSPIESPYRPNSKRI